MKAVRWLKSWFGCVPFVTLLILLAIDILLRQGNFLDAAGYHTIDVWGVPPRIELCKKTNPDVALVGSSLLLVLSQDDAGRHFYSGNYPPYLQDQLRKISGNQVKCANLCSGLQMVSEAYLLTECLAADPKPPKVIIFGLALRDFIHDQCGREWRGESFASIAPYLPMSPALVSHMTSPHAVEELLLDHYWFLYRQHADFKNVFFALTKDALERLPLDQPYYRLGNDHTWRPQSDGFLKERWVPRQQEKFTEAIYRTHPEFLRNYYKGFQAEIYQQGREDTMKIQTHYLEEMIALCQRKGIKLVLVDMPLSPEIAALAPPGEYDSFRVFLSRMAAGHNVALIDLYGDKEFRSEDFKDGVHLNFDGSRRLADRIVADLQNQYPQVLAALKEHPAARGVGN